MCKQLLIMVVLVCYTTVTNATERFGVFDVVVVNVAGTNVGINGMKFPPGTTRMPQTTLVCSNMMAGPDTYVSLDDAGETWIIADGASLAYSDKWTRAKAMEWFWAGFGLVFCAGLLALGAKWVHRIMGGNESYE